MKKEYFFNQCFKVWVLTNYMKLRIRKYIKFSNQHQIQKGIFAKASHIGRNEDSFKKKKKIIIMVISQMKNVINVSENYFEAVHYFKIGKPGDMNDLA